MCGASNFFFYTQSQAQIYMTRTHKISLNELFKFLENENNIFEKVYCYCRKVKVPLSGQNW